MNIDINLLDVLKLFLNTYQGNSYTFIADKILEAGKGYGKSHRTLRRYLSAIDEADDTVTDTDKVDPDDTPEEAKDTIFSDLYCDDDNYEFGEIEFSGELIDSIFCAYSRQGLNYTREQIVQAMNISEEFFSSLVSKLHLSKDSFPLGPKSSDADDITKTSRLQALSEYLLNIFVDAGNPLLTSLIRKYKKITTEVVNSSNSKLELLKSMDKHLADMLPINYTPKPYSEDSNRLYIVIADQHIGMETKEYNSGIAQQALRDIVDMINSTVDPEANITLLMLGDILHSVSGTNHPDTWKSLEQNMWGALSIIKPFELMLEFITSIPQINEVYGVGGNHSRLAADKRKENSDEGEKLLYYMLERSLPFKVVFDPDEVLVKGDTYNIILQHGDRTADKRSGRDIAWDVGTPDKFNLILQGHTHARQINKNDDSINYRKLVAPSFCPSDSYAIGLGYRTLPGILLFSFNKSGHPIMVDYPIKY